MSNSEVLVLCSAPVVRKVLALANVVFDRFTVDSGVWSQRGQEQFIVSNLCIYSFLHGTVEMITPAATRNNASTRKMTTTRFLVRYSSGTSYILSYSLHQSTIPEVHVAINGGWASLQGRQERPSSMVCRRFFNLTLGARTGKAR